MSWPDFVKLPECKAKKHDKCPEWERNADGVKLRGCTCGCHTRKDDEDVSAAEEA